MTCTFICGKPRKGKTLYVTMNGYYDYQKGRRIFANYKLNFPYTRVDINDLLTISTMEMEISPKTVLIQEASKWFDARRSGRQENVLLSSFTGQSGKREIDIIYDDQFPTRIDKGLRDITDYTFIADCIKDENDKPVMFEYFMHVGFMGPYMGRVLRFPAFMMEQFYGLYDTREPTIPLGALER